MDLEELSAYLGNTSEAFDHLNSAILIVYRERDLYTGKGGKHIEKQTTFLFFKSKLHQHCSFQRTCHPDLDKYGSSKHRASF